MRYLPYVYFLRIPLLFAIAVVILPVTGLWLAQPTIGGFFDLDFWGTAVVSIAALLLSSVLSINTNLVLLYGRARFFAAKLSPEALKTSWSIGALGIPRIARGFIVFYAICGLFVIAGAIKGPAGSQDQLVRGAAAGLGVLVFLVILLVSVGLWTHAGAAATVWFAKRLEWTPWGYLRLKPGIDPEDPEARRRGWPFLDPPKLLAGHGLALLMLGVFVLFYAMFAFGRYVHLSGIANFKPEQWWIGTPTLGSVILLLILLALILSSLAYLLDRYRVPVLLPLAAVATIGAQFAQSDHYYEVVQLKDDQTFTPLSALTPRAGGLKDGVILVAASGGGIHAAAWTARVLGGLVKELNDDRFSRSIAAISSVSGGSAGSLYFVHAYEDGRVDPSLAGRIFQAGAASSLDDTAWGLVYPDVWRSVAPFLLSARVDRGWAMETSWQNQMETVREVETSVGWPTLGGWREDARKGLRPSVIFNTTLVETGERFLFPTVDLAPAPGRRSFHDLVGYGGLDLRANTAARLSATFPYVTPVSRAACCPPQSQRFHIADGGYYDNFGISSIVELVHQAAEKGRPVARILIVQIRLAPDVGGYGTARGQRGWFFQAFAPILTLYKMRDAAQASRNVIELGLLKEALAAREENKRIDVQVATFSYIKPANERCKPQASGVAPAEPLSWHLTKANIEDIHDTWKAYVCEGTEIGKVKAFLGGS
jgi:hypothetical protein